MPAPAPPPGKPRKTSKRVQSSAACEPLKAMYADAVKAKPTSWNQVEAGFLKAMEGFDANVASGRATAGDWQNGKGDFLNDLIALILEGCAEIELYARGRVPGFIFERHNLDVTYPNTGVVQFTLEAKATGAPIHPRNKGSQKNPLGRPGGADLDKRVKEGAFKVIDLKAEYSRIMTMSGHSPTGGPGGNLTSWLRTQKPSGYLFVASRVVGKGDLANVIRRAENASQMFDKVGVYCFEPQSVAAQTTYSPVPLTAIPTHLQLERVLFAACQELREIDAKPPIPYPGTGAP